MFISKITLNESFLKRQAFTNIFGGGYALHQAVWDLFADASDRCRDFLYRLDTIGKMPIIYTVSTRKPEDTQGLWQIENKPYDPLINNGMRLGFTVRVNPTCKRDGKRHDVVMDAKYKMRSQKQAQEKMTPEIIAETIGKWFEARSEKNGFKVLQCRADGYRQEKVYKIKSSVEIQYRTADITGVLEIMEEKIFKIMLFSGFGPEKGFGCGLMLVRKI